MISIDLAQRLSAAGLQWTPANGDRFAVIERDLDGQVFVVSDMVVEVQQRGYGQVLGFNGTTEWALDSLGVDEALWLPRESDLRNALGEAFLSLEAALGPLGVSYVVHVATPRGVERHVDVDTENAYARAWLACR